MNDSSSNPTKRTSAAPNEAVILDADHSLMRKLGNVPLDKILTPQAVQKAEAVITEAADTFYLDCVQEAGKLRALTEKLDNRHSDNSALLKDIVAISFAIKTKAAQSGYTLIAEIAKSLHLFCEEWTARSLTDSALKIIRWHEQSIRQLTATKITGAGGEIGKNILAELEKLRLAV